MRVIKERFEDAGELNENGYYDHYCSGLNYRIVVGHEAFLVRQYEDTPWEASFLNCEVKGRRKWRRQHFDRVPYDSPAFQRAVEYLLEQAGISEIKVLMNEYVAVDLGRLGQK